MQKSLYQNTARFYDKGSEIQSYDYDIDFYKSFINENTSVLEIGCGTGRVTLALLDNCNHITGIDLSSQMLEILKSKVEKLEDDQQKKINLYKSDMRKFNLNNKFDLIIMPGITFQALLNDLDRNKCLNNIKNHLKSDGKIIIDFFHSDINKVNNIGEKRIDFEYFDDTLNSKVKKHSIIEEHDSKNQVHKMKYTFELLKEDKILDVIEDYFELSYLYPQQSEELFKRKGFNIINKYGWYDFTEINEDNKRMMIYLLETN